MSQNNKKNAQESLGANVGKASGSKRKMTQNIIEEKQQEEDVYQFLEEDDDFEEFEQTNVDEEEAKRNIDVDMAAGGDADKPLWQQDWDDEEVDEDFGAKLRAQLAKWTGEASSEIVKVKD